LIAHFIKCRESIDELMRDLIESTIPSLEAKRDAEFDLVSSPDSGASPKTTFMQFQLEAIQGPADLALLEHLKQRVRILQDLQVLVDTLIEDPKPVSIKLPFLQPILTPESSHVVALRRAIEVASIPSQIISNPLRSPIFMKTTFQNTLATAMSTVKKGISYFPELPIEGSLRLFLRSSQSPLHSKSLLPYSQGDDPTAMKAWIQEVIATILEWFNDGVRDDKRDAALAVIVVRFFFWLTFPQFEKNVPFDLELAHKMAIFVSRTPGDLGIAPKYVPPGYADRAVSELFEIDSISRAPLEWFQEALFQYCPLDAAFCVMKAHESLSVMAVLRDAASHGDAEKQSLCDKLPGFDDVFELWLAMVAMVAVLNPEGLFAFIEGYSRLPGFSTRILVPVTYLEATLTHFKEN
jgi:hypothetical protein